MRTVRNMLLTPASVALLALAACLSEPDGPNYGFVQVLVQTSGGDMDDQYTLMVDAQRRVSGPNANLVFSVAAGTHVVQLSDVAPNCALNSPASVSFEIDNGDTRQITFTIACQATGLEVKIGTTGDDLPGTYELVVNTQGSRLVSPNSTTTYRRMAPGSYTVELNNVIPSCTLTGPSKVTLQLAAGTIAAVAFDISCAALPRPEKIAYVYDSSSAGNTVSYIGTALPDGTGALRITEGNAVSWSPDGKRIVYSKLDCDVYYYYSYCLNGLRIRDPESGNDIALTHNFDPITPAWSPSGSVIAFVNSTNKNLYLVSRDGGELIVVAIPTVTQIRNPAWSPDGERLAFGCNIQDGPNELCIARKDGSGLAVLTTGPELEAHPAWSPDGSTIAFSMLVNGEWEIRTMPSTGGASTGVAPGFHPAWSRGGTYLIFARAEGLFLMRPNGAGLTQLTAGKQRAPVWRP